MADSTSIKFWRGGAAAVVDVWDLTVANTWAAADTATITIGTKDLVITSGSSTIATIVTEIIASINATSFDDPTPPASFSRTTGGQAIPEFTEVFAEAHPTNTAIVRIKARQAGVPIGLTCSEVTAGTGTITASNTTPATGPNFVNNADNYLGGAVPADDDTVWFNSGSVDALYGLTHFRTNSLDLTLNFTNDWKGQLGLPAYNQSGGYPEYRQRYFQHFGPSKTIQILPGLDGNINAGNIYLDLTDQATVQLQIYARRNAGAQPSVYIAGAAATVSGYLRVTAGSVAIEPDDAPTATNRFCGFVTLDIGQPNNSSDEPTVYIGQYARLSVATTLEQHSGRVITYAQTPTSQNTVIRGGAMELRAEGVTHGGFEVYSGATLYPIGVSVIGAVYCYSGSPGGVLDYRRATSAAGAGGAHGELRIHKGAALYDPNQVSVATFQTTGCTLADIGILAPPNKKYTISAAT